MEKPAYREMKFVENFIEFGVLHRARVAWGLLEQFQGLPEEEESMRGSMALDLLQTHLNTYEDVVLWLQVIEKWRDDHPNIPSVLEQARFHPKQTEKLDRLIMHSILGGGGTGEQFARTCVLPYKDTDDWSRVRPERRDSLRSEIDELARLSNVFFFNAHFLTESREVALWRAWNKTKHGLFVTLTHDHARGTLITVHTDPEDLSHAYELRVDYYDLVQLLVSTFIGCVFLGRTLNAVYQLRYERVPDVSWLPLAISMDMRNIGRGQLSAVLTASRIPRQHLVLGAGPRTTPHHFEAAFGFKLADDWWPRAK